MRIERDGSGDFVLDPAALASRFGLSSSVFRSNLQRGFITSMIEQGQGEDAGTWRLTLRFGNRVWQVIINAEDEIVTETMNFSHAGARKG